MNKGYIENTNINRDNYKLCFFFLCDIKDYIWEIYVGLFENDGLVFVLLLFYDVLYFIICKWYNIILF